MTIGRRILVLILAPLAALSVFAGWTLWERMDAYRESRFVAASESALAGLESVVASTQVERGRSAQFLGRSETAPPPALLAQRRETDAALAALGVLAGTPDMARLAAELEAALAATAPFEALRRQMQLEAAARRDRQALAAGQAAHENDRRGAETARTAATAATAEIARALAELRRNRLDYRIAAELPAGFGQLGIDFNAAMDEVEATLGSVRETANNVRAQAGEIAAASDELARRAERQSAKLEESSDAMRGLLEVIEHTAQSSLSTKDGISAARQQVDENGAVVRKAQAAIERIRDSSQRIGAIIGAIDEIAFQTNLLALNAGVEAARAGEAGRGFAVVAAEVRALALRSAEAAKEIKQLVGQSATEVGAGVELVGEAGRAFGRIEQQIAVIDGGVADIAGQTMGQTIKLKQVTTALAEMDADTQQNAAMAEQATASCRAMSEESQRLHQLIGRFSIRSAETEPPRKAA